MAKHYTPLRYPGGKAKFADFLKLLLKQNRLLDGEYAEPYAGGAGAAIELLLTGCVSRIHLNDLNYPVYCFWRSILKEPEAFCQLISKTKLDMETWHGQRHIVENAHDYSELAVGFALFYMNRTNRSGIISGGVIGGYEQTGTWKIDARFTRQELIKRIQQIARHANAIKIYNLDAMKFLDKMARSLPQKSLIYLDPPYYEQGQRLYDNFYTKEEHGDIAQRIAQLRTPWLVSYDDVSAIRTLYRNFQQTSCSLLYSAAKSYKGSEVVIFSKNLSIPGTFESRALSIAV